MIFQVTYLSDGLKVKGYLGLPNGYRLAKTELKQMICSYHDEPNLKVREIAQSINQEKHILSARLPALIYCRGGRGKFGRVKTDWIERFTSHGYVVFAPAYRGVDGGKGRDDFGGADREDVHSALQLLQNLPFIDSRRISIMGFSRGSINATLTAAEMDGVYKLILWSGIADLFQTYRERPDLQRMLRKVLGGSPAKQPDAYLTRSPLAMTDRIKCPVLIVHGTEDRNVPINHGYSMYQRLQEIGTEVEMHEYKGYAHYLPFELHKQAVAKMFAWIEKAPGNKKPPIGIISGITP